MQSIQQALRWLFSRPEGLRSHLLARWLFLRALGLVFFSAFYALIFQARGLIGVNGILPAPEYLQSLRPLGLLRLWYAPTLLWLHPTNPFLMTLCWAGLIASLLLAFNILPRPSTLVCVLCFLSFAAAAQDFAGYQSDGMLLEAGFLALFIAPAGFRPRLGPHSPPIRAAYLLLLWEWFRIYFESGIVKLTSGDPTWHNLTAMYEYYQNGPLPTWIGWYLQHLPHWFHIASAALTLLMELGIVWIAFVSRRLRIVCFWIVTVWQAVVIATANYAFLNYLVLILAFLLLDDRYLHRFQPIFPTQTEPEIPKPSRLTPLQTSLAAVAFIAVMLTGIAYATTVPLLQMLWPAAPFPRGPIEALEPFRIANQYGLFATMTPHRYEIEFQGSNDNQTWTPYPFLYKPQDPHVRPRIYAPYQPRFDWNLWFASLGPWQENAMVPRTEGRLLTNDRDVLGLFGPNPFLTTPPRYIRAVLWQYWFSTPEEKRTRHVWWRRQLLGTYAPTLTLTPDGRFAIVEPATLTGPPQP